MNPPMLMLNLIEIFIRTTPFTLQTFHTTRKNEDFGIFQDQNTMKNHRRKSHEKENFSQPNTFFCQNGSSKRYNC